MTVATLLAEAKKLSFDERLELVEAIWDDIAAQNRPIEISETQRAELHRRLEEHDANPASSLNEVEMNAFLETLRTRK